MQTIDTQAGDDSEGKIWGLEGNSLLIVIGGIVSGVIMTVSAFSYWNCPPVMALGYGTVPAILGIIYVFTLRERRPKAFDKDLLETLICGRSWQHQRTSKPHPLLLVLVYFLLPGSLHAQFVPSNYMNVEGGKNYEFTLLRDEPFGIHISAHVLWNHNGTLHTGRLILNDQEVLVNQSSLHGDTGSGTQHGSFARLIQGPMKAGTKIRLKCIIEAPGDPSARLIALGATSWSYDGVVHLNNLEAQVKSLEALLQKRIDQNASRINEIASQLGNLKSDLNEFRKRFDALDLEFSQFKTNIILRLNDIEKRILSLENEFKSQIAAVNQRIDALDLDHNQFKINTASRFNASDKKISVLQGQFETLNLDHSKFKTDTVTRLDSLGNKISLNRDNIVGLNNRFDNFDRNYSRFKTDTNTRLEKADKGITSLFEGLNQFKTETNSRVSAINEKHSHLEKRFAKFQADHSGFKTHVDSRFDAINKRHSSLENKFGTELNGLTQKLDKFQGEQKQQNIGINSRLNALDKTFFEKANSFERQLSALERRNLRRDRLNNTLGIIGVSLGGSAAAIAVGGAYYQFLQEKQEKQQEKKP